MAGEISRRLKEIETALDPAAIAKHGYDYFKKVTPIDTGNARNNTRLNNTTIEAAYPYAQRLDNGSSKQAPLGMTQPTVEELKRYVKKQSKG